MDVAAGAAELEIAEARDAEQAERHILEAVAIARAAADDVDAVAARPGRGRRNAGILAARSDLGRRAHAVAAAIFRACLGAERPERIGAAHRDDAAQRLGAPERRLRAADQLQPAEPAGGQRVEAARIGGGDVVEGDAVDEDEGVVRFGAADADHRLRALRAGRRDRDAGGEPDEIGRQGRAERIDQRLVEQSDRRGRFGRRDRRQGRGDDDLAPRPAERPTGRSGMRRV